MSDCNCQYQDHPYGDTYVTEHIQCQECYQKELDSYKSRFSNDDARMFLVLLLQLSPDEKIYNNGVAEQCRYCTGRSYTGAKRFDEFKVKHYQHCPYALALNQMLGDEWDERRPLFVKESIRENTFGEVGENGEELEIPF